MVIKGQLFSKLEKQHRHKELLPLHRTSDDDCYITHKFLQMLFRHHDNGYCMVTEVVHRVWKKTTFVMSSCSLITCKVKNLLSSFMRSLVQRETTITHAFVYCHKVSVVVNVRHNQPSARAVTTSILHDQFIQLQETAQALVYHTSMPKCYKQKSKGEILR